MFKAVGGVKMAVGESCVACVDTGRRDAQRGDGGAKSVQNAMVRNGKDKSFVRFDESVSARKIVNHQASRVRRRLSGWGKGKATLT